VADDALHRMAVWLPPRPHGLADHDVDAPWIQNLRLLFGLRQRDFVRLRPNEKNMTDTELEVLTIAEQIATSQGKEYARLPHDERLAIWTDAEIILAQSWAEHAEREKKGLEVRK